MFIHPEIRQQFYLAKSHVAHNKPGWSNDAVCEAARNKIWAQNLEETNMFLKQVCYMPSEAMSSTGWLLSDEVFEQETDDLMGNADSKYDEEEI